MVEVPMPSDCQGETEVKATEMPEGGTLLQRTWSCDRCPKATRQDSAISPVLPTDQQLINIARASTEQFAGRCLARRAAKAALN